jgi:NAD(P)-dependent dehydrogenase (short-subunit alcohol dehydrogenase family)
VNPQGKTFLVSGGASGLGAATTRALVARGANVLIADLNPNETLASELGSRARFVVTDVADERAVQTAIDAARAAFGSLHGAVCCAGVVHAEKLVGDAGPHALASFEKVVRVNLIGSFNVLRLVATALHANDPDSEGERGVLIATASIAAFEGQVGQAAYAASKGGVASLTLPLARELARHGIRVVTIAPGVFDTPLLAGVREDIRESLRAHVPFPPRLGRPEEYAALALHAIENPMLNGVVLRLDGALRLPPR